MHLSQLHHQRPFHFLSAALAASASIAHADVRYVDDDAAEGGDGLSWSTAYRSLQDALDEAADDPLVDSIWVAEGFYTPVKELEPGDERSATFSIPDGVAIYGGFAAGERTLAERIIEKHPTILSGDREGDDASPFLNRDDNAYTVVLIANVSATMDGFVIQGGNSNLDDEFTPGGLGGGVLIDGAHAVVSRCRFEDNEAFHGGALGIRLPASRVEVVSCTFLNNRAVASTVGGTGSGGAAYGSGLTEDNVRYTNCLFLGNRADQAGAAIFADHANHQILHCTIVGNECTGGPPNWGAAVELMGTIGSISIANSIIWGNRSENPAGIEFMQVHVPRPQFMLEVDASCVEQWSGDFPGDGTHGLDPLFADALGPDGEPGTGDEDLHLTQESPCLDEADADEIPPDVADLNHNGDQDEDLPFDLDGAARIAGRAPDMGAYEGFQESCIADVTGDGSVGFDDLLVLLAAWGSCASCDLCPSDLNGSCDVGFEDLLTLLSAWGVCP